MNRLIAAASAGIIAMAATVGAANATTTPTAVVATSAAAYAASASVACLDLNGYNNTNEFWRCTGPDESSQWVGSSCNVGQYNAGTYYNVYGAINLCGKRVWLHEYTYPAYTSPTNPGWTVCVNDDGGWYEYIGGIFPDNIMVSSNPAAC